MRFQNQTLYWFVGQYNAQTHLYDYSPGPSYDQWKTFKEGPFASDHIQPTNWTGEERLVDGDAYPCLVDTTDKYHIAGNCVQGVLGLDDRSEPVRAEWLMDEATARLAGNYDVLMNTRSWCDAARAIGSWADNFWSLYQSLRRNPRRAWGSFRRFAKRCFYRSLRKAPEEIVRGLPTAAREYCAIKYGALPIIHDLRDTLNRLNRPKSSVRVIATARCPADPAVVYSTDTFGGIQTVRIVENYSAIAVRYLSTDSVESFRNFGDLVQTPLYTVWDAIPWSFVIDWFLPVGNALLQVQPFGFNVTRGFDCCRYSGYNVLQVSDGAIRNYGAHKVRHRFFVRRANTSMALGLNKAVSHYIAHNEQLSYVKQVGRHLIDLYALGRSRLH